MILIWPHQARRGRKSGRPRIRRCRRNVCQRGTVRRSTSKRRKDPSLPKLLATKKRGQWPALPMPSKVGVSMALGRVTVVADSFVLGLVLPACLLPMPAQRTGGGGANDVLCDAE